MFVEGEVGYPVYIKALDGGGGRRMTAVSCKEGLRRFVRISASRAYADLYHFRYIGKSPSSQLFADKALYGSRWKHFEALVEVRIIILSFTISNGI